MSIISASTTSTTAYKVTADTTGTLVLQTGSTPTTAVTIDGSQNVTLAGNITLNNGAADGAQLSLASSGYSNWNIDNYTGRFRWYYNTTEYMTLDASGNLGVGTTSPTSISNYKSITINGTTGSLIDLASNGTTGGRLQCDTNYPGMALFALTNSPMVFGTNGTERARIDASGNLLVGTTSAITGNNNAFVVNSANTAFLIKQSGGGIANAVWHAGSGSQTLIGFFAGSGPTAVGSITTNGTSTTYGTSSDYRLKHDIAPMTGALAKVAQLKPVTYKWNIDGSAGQGFIAHELQAVVPDAVVGEKDAVNEDGSIKPQGIDTSFLVATLTAAIQEQQAIIETLTNRITALEAK